MQKIGICQGVGNLVDKISFSQLNGANSRLGSQPPWRKPMARYGKMDRRKAQAKKKERERRRRTKTTEPLDKKPSQKAIKTTQQPVPGRWNKQPGGLWWCMVENCSSVLGESQDKCTRPGCPGVKPAAPTQPRPTNLGRY